MVRVALKYLLLIFNLDFLVRWWVFFSEIVELLLGVSDLGRGVAGGLGFRMVLRLNISVF
jgi:hypothetical protein